MTKTEVLLHRRYHGFLFPNPFQIVRYFYFQSCSSKSIQLESLKNTDSTSVVTSSQMLKTL